MSTKALALGVIGCLSVGAAAAGGYLALRVNTANPAPVAAATPAATPVDATTIAVAPARAEAAAPDAKPVRAAAAGSRRDTAPSAQAVDRSGPKQPNRPVAPAAASPVESASAAATAGAPAAATPAKPAATSDATTSAAAEGRYDPPPPAADPPKPVMEEVTIGDDAVIGITVDSRISTETAKLEDKVTARVARDVVVNGRTAIPAGARLEGIVTTVEHGGKFKNVARLGVRFETLVLADNTRIPLRTEPIIRAGESPKGEAASKIGASAVVGTILGAVIGGKKGAVIGATAGAAAGTGAVMAGGVNEAVIAAGTPLAVRLTAPLKVLVERQQ